MTIRFISEYDLDKLASKVESLLTREDPYLLSSLDEKPYKIEAIRYILLAQYRVLAEETYLGLSKYDIFCNQFLWHSISRGIIQSVEPDSLLFVGDMDDVLGSPSGFFDKGDVDDLYEKSEFYISSWIRRNQPHS